MSGADGNGALGKPMWHPACLLATWFGTGLLPWAPGTWGSLAALPFAWLILSYLGPAWLFIAASLVFLAGWWASSAMVRERDAKDPGHIVIDEVAGQLLVLVAAPLELRFFALGFALFRLADIVKPWPASWADRRLKGGLGVMADDVLAAVYALIILFALSIWWE